MSCPAFTAASDQETRRRRGTLHKPPSHELHATRGESISTSRHPQPLRAHPRMFWLRGRQSWKNLADAVERHENVRLSVASTLQTRAHVRRHLRRSPTPRRLGDGGNILVWPGETRLPLFLPSHGRRVARPSSATLVAHVFLVELRPPETASDPFRWDKVCAALRTSSQRERSGLCLPWPTSRDASVMGSEGMHRCRGAPSTGLQSTRSV